ncbi:hypothetical protein B4589_008030 [Halolamina sp. CBA1230]|uniref:hypothetical protein n=1 Tax=Halolamina sp. CBA1230 TaxID=1853690 RepID=UPI0009A19B17|nr:hypothetical protein [Halolamina sp. CBA1230]QKY20329.1 hypothetical protein B4589_008030 [Halolamina sp. CBA1230]
MDWNRPLGVVLVLVGVALAVPVALEPPTAEAGGPAVIGAWIDIVLRGGGGLLAVAVGCIAFLDGRTRLAATTLTAYAVVVLAYLARMRQIGPERPWPYVGLWLIVLVVAVAVVRRVVEPKSGASMLESGG